MISAKSTILSTISLAILASNALLARAELPPYVYEEQKADASEVLYLEITDVAIASELDTETTDYFSVDAVVNQIVRSTSNIAVNSSVKFYLWQYVDGLEESGFVGPSEPELVTEGMCILAYLNLDEEKSVIGEGLDHFVFQLAAGGQSLEYSADEKCMPVLCGDTDDAEQEEIDGEEEAEEEENEYTENRSIRRFFQSFLKRLRSIWS